MSQYDLTIMYVCGEDNTITNVLSQLPPNCFANEMPPLVCINNVNVILTMTTDHDILERIKAGYLNNKFCKCVATTSMKGWELANNLCT